jgi:DnaJ-class molecular chaperone
MALDFDPSVDFYKALGVDAKASNDEIKKAYRKLAKQYHPDSTGGDKAKEARFKEASAAYDVLGDAKKRAQYDEIRAMGGGRGRMAGGFPGGGFTPGGVPGGNGQVWDLGDLFAQMFQGGGAQRAGGRRSVRFEQFGEDDDGWVFETRSGGPQGASARAGDGAGMEGKVHASDGTWLAVKGTDVYSDVRVSFHAAMLGTVAEVATIDGVSSVKIPPGTSSGKKLRLRGKGVAGPTGPGDHYVTVQIDVPGNLDDKAKKLLHDLTAHLARDTKGRSR